jgi:hypothetical protein
MVESPANRVLSLSAKLVLERLEIELYQHGGKSDETGSSPARTSISSSSAFTVTRLDPQSVSWWRWASSRLPGRAARGTRASDRLRYTV